MKIYRYTHNYASKVLLMFFDEIQMQLWQNIFRNVIIKILMCTHDYASKVLLMSFDEIQMLLWHNIFMNIHMEYT